MHYIVAFNGCLKCPLKIHLNTQLCVGGKGGGVEAPFEPPAPWFHRSCLQSTMCVLAITQLHVNASRSRLWPSSNLINFIG